MSFAVKLSKQECSTADCPELDKHAGKEIDSMISSVADWKEKRLVELFNEVSQTDLSESAEGLGAVSEKNSLRLRYMGREISVSGSGFQEELGIWDKLLVLMYIKNSGHSILTGKWTAFRELKNGLIRANSFNKACEKYLAGLFGSHEESFIQALTALGAEKVTGYSADYSFLVRPLPKIPFLVLLWSGDEDFSPDCKVLLDSTATDFLDVEALLYLGMALARTIKAQTN